MISQFDSRDPYRHPTKNRDNHLLKISIFKSCMSLLENSESLSPNSVMSRSDFWLLAPSEVKPFPSYEELQFSMALQPNP